MPFMRAPNCATGPHYRGLPRGTNSYGSARVQPGQYGKATWRSRFDLGVQLAVVDRAYASGELRNPDGIRFDGKRLVGTGTTLPLFNYLTPISHEKKELVDQTGVEPVTS